jgi:hypothetical protein
MRPSKCRFCQSTQKIVVDEQNTEPPHVKDPIFRQHLMVLALERLP